MSDNTCLVCGWECNKTIKEQLEETDEAGLNLLDYSDKLGLLLVNEILLCNTDNSQMPFNVICNDTFAWGSADCHPIRFNEIEELFDYVMKDGELGAIKWCAYKRQMRPQQPMIDIMAKKGVLEPWVEQLPNYQ